MFVVLIAIAALVWISGVTWLSYKLGTTKTENAKMAGVIGFFLAFLPPLALIYLVVLLFKEETSIV